MGNVLLVRHGEPDYENGLLINEESKLSLGVSSVGLSSTGIKNCEEAAEIVSSFNPRVLVSSPYTRALHSALIFAAHKYVPIFIEKNLVEWMTNCSIILDGRNVYDKMLLEVTHHDGVYDESCEFIWESLNELKRRALSVIYNYSERYDSIAVVSHKMLIYQLTGKSLPFCGYVETTYEDLLRYCEVK